MRWAQLKCKGGKGRPAALKAQDAPTTTKFSAVRGICESAPETSTENCSAYSRVNSSQTSTARPQDSKPGPRFATVAGTQTVTRFWVRTIEAFNMPWSSSCAVDVRPCLQANCSTSGNKLELPPELSLPHSSIPGSKLEPEDVVGWLTVEAATAAAAAASTAFGGASVGAGRGGASTGNPMPAGAGGSAAGTGKGIAGRGLDAGTVLVVATVTVAAAITDCPPRGQNGT
mmetsp:Transcript_17427/g.39459  ORF Transcript_17427/g.39459 Transcript_17427/m.39459 type:complete len:229 (-) Transcript_17427:25-711(-)